MLRNVLHVAAIAAAGLIVPAQAAAQDAAGERPPAFNVRLDGPSLGPTGSVLALNAAALDDAADRGPLFRLGGSISMDPQRASGRGLTFTHACAAEVCEAIARTALRVRAEDWSVSIGAKAALANKLESIVGPGGRSSWYVFVAADAQAMSWNLGDRGTEEGPPVHLGDMRLVGDIQAGIGSRLAGGDLALGYLTREVSHLGADRRESFVGVTFGWEG